LVNEVAYLAGEIGTNTLGNADEQEPVVVEKRNASHKIDG
jgi:hypothetical protein